LGMLVLSLLHLTWPLVLVFLFFINAGIFITCWRRIRHLSIILKQKSNA